MPQMARQLAWSGLAVAAVILALVLDWLVSPPAADLPPPPEQFLRGQTCSGSRAQLDVDGASVHLVGVFTTALDGRAPGRVSFLLDSSLTVASVRVGEVLYERHHPALDDVLAAPRDRHVFASPGPRAEGPGPHALEIRYHGSALAVSMTTRERPVPLVLSTEAHYVPRFAAEPVPVNLQVSTPESWAVWTEREVEARTVDRGRAHHRIASGAVPGLMVLGPLHETRWSLGPISVADQEVGPYEVRAVSRNEQLRSQPVERALAAVTRFLPDLLPARLDLILVPGLEPREPRQLDGTTWLLPEPISSHDWVEGLAHIARAPVLEVAPSLHHVDKAIALMSIPAGADEKFEEALWAYRQEEGFQEVQAWAVLMRMPGGPSYLEDTFRTWIERWRANPDEPEGEQLFADLTAHNTFTWVSQEPGVDVRLRDVSVRTSGNRVELSAEVQVSPSPPKVHGLPALELLVVYADRSEVVELANLQDRIPITLKNLVQRPLRVVLDPADRYPDRDRSNNAVSLNGGPEPATFAVTRDSSLLAITPAASHDGFPSGLYVYDLAAEQPGPPVWHEMPGRVQAMSWIEPERLLFLTYAGRDEEPVHCVFNWREGRVRRFPAGAEPGPDGEAVLLHRLRMPGRYRHGCYWLGTRYEVPFLNQYGGRLRWVGNANLLVAEQEDGHGGILDLNGRLVANLGLAAQEVRDVLSTPFGYTFVTDGARGSQLQLVDTQSQLVTLFPSSPEHPVGRIQGYFLSVAPAFFYVYLEGESGDHHVYRFTQQGATYPLYQGRARPMAELHSSRGVILAAEDARPLRPLRELSFHSYDRDRGKDAEPQTLCKDVFLDPAPVLASEGRFLYYIRSEAEPVRIAPEHRPRGIYRYDFLTQREEPLFGGRGG